MSHTKGPWNVSGVIPGAVVAASCPNENLLGLDVGGYAIFMKREDAVIAAAAPEMLGALHGAKALLEFGGIGTDNAILANVIAAIAKATGGNS